MKNALLILGFFILGGTDGVQGATSGGWTSENSLLAFVQRCRLMLQGGVRPLEPRAQSGPTAARNLDVGKLLGAYDPTAIATAWQSEKLSSPQMQNRLSGLRRDWAITGGKAIALSAGTGAEKAAAYERLVAEIQKRGQAISNAANQVRTEFMPNYFSPWEATRREVGNGVVIFVGGYGNLLEFRPDGSVYYGIVVREDVYPEDAHWVPPYHDGIADLSRFKGHYLERLGP